MNYEEKTIAQTHIYSGKIISVDRYTVELPNGKEATRDIVAHPGASAVVPLTREGELFMVKQYRKPIESISLEIPAGKLDQGEEPMTCAIRELKEETGLEAGEVRHLISIHSTPGFSNEILHLYLATELKEGDSCADEDEFVSTEKLPVKDLIQRVLDHEITDAKTIIGILLAEKVIKGEI